MNQTKVARLLPASDRKVSLYLALIAVPIFIAPNLDAFVSTPPSRTNGLIVQPFVEMQSKTLCNTLLDKE